MDMDRYPAGLRVLTIDDDCTGLLLLKKQLNFCNYNNVTTVTDAMTAWDMLRERKGRDDQFDLVISDIFMVDGGIDGLKLLEHISLEMDIPVIMLSANDDKETMTKGIKNGACDYLVKPARLSQLRNIWMHVARNNMKNPRNKVIGGKDGAGQTLLSGDGENNENDGANHTRKYPKKNKKDGNHGEEDKDGTSTQKKQRVQWTGQLHNKFLEAINKIGMEKAVPVKILEEMNVDGLSRECIASHLQKYRIYLKKLNDGMSVPESSQHQKELGRHEAFPSLVGACSHNPFARTNSPSAIGMHSVLPTQSAQHISAQRSLGIPLQQDTETAAQGVNLPKDAVCGNFYATAFSGGLSGASQCFPSGSSSSTSANISNIMVFSTGFSATSGSSCASISNDSSQLGANMRIPSSRSCTSYASILRGKMVDANRGIPFDADNIFEEIIPAYPSHLPLQSRELVIQPSVQIQSSSAGLYNQLAPPSHLQLQPPELVHQPSVQFQSSPIGQFNQVAREPHQLAGNSNSSSSTRAGVPSRYFDHIGHIAGTSIGSNCGNEYQNQMSGLMGITTPVISFSEQMTVNSGSITSSTVLLIGNSSLGSSSSIRPALPNLLIGNSVMPNHMPLPDGGGATDIFLGDCNVDQQFTSVVNQVNNSNELPARTSETQDGTNMDELFSNWMFY